MSEKVNMKLNCLVKPICFLKYSFKFKNDVFFCQCKSETGPADATQLSAKSFGFLLLAWQIFSMRSIIKV